MEGALKYENLLGSAGCGTLGRQKQGACGHSPLRGARGIFSHKADGVNTGPQCTVSILLSPRLQPIGMVLSSPWVDLPNLPSSLETPS